MGLPARPGRPLGGSPRPAPAAQALRPLPLRREPRGRAGPWLPSVGQIRLAVGCVTSRGADRGIPGCSSSVGDQRPFGIFDSGEGGLTVLKEIPERLPLEPTIYVAALRHFPYVPPYQDEARAFAIITIAYRGSRNWHPVVAHGTTGA